MKTYAHTKTYTGIFITTLSLIAKNWTQLRCLSMGEWLNQVGYEHTMEYHSTAKRKKLLTHSNIFNESPGNYTEYKKP